MTREGQGREEVDASDFADHPDTRGGKTLVGVTEDDAPIYYDVKGHEKFEGDTGSDEHAWADREELSPDVSLADFVRQVGEEVGWKSLSEFGREHSDDGNAE